MSKKSTLPKKTVLGPVKKAPPRKVELINQDYAKYCGELGQMKYNYMVLESQMNEHMAQIYKLKQEAIEAEKIVKETSQANEQLAEKI